MGHPNVGRLSNIWRQYPAECNLKVHSYKMTLAPGAGRIEYARPNAISNHIPAYYYLFSVVKGVKKHKQRLFANPYFSEFIKEDLEKYDKFIPAKLNNEVALKDFCKYYKSHIEMPENMELAFQMVCTVMDRHLTSFDRADISQVLAETQWDTSVGNPWSGMPDPVTKRCPISKRSLEASPLFHKYFDLYYESLKTDDPMGCLFTDFNKEEIRPREKVEEDKTRGICSAPYEHTRACAIELQNLHRQMMALPTMFPWLYGFSPYYGGWNELIKEMVRFGSFANGSDASQFDSSIREWFYDLFYRFCVRYMSFKDLPERKKVLLNLLRQACYGAVVLTTNDVVFTPFGNKTGQYITYMFNCFVNFTMNAYAEVRVYKNCSASVWMRRCKLKCSGDDLMQVQPTLFSMEPIASAIGELGITVNPDYPIPVSVTDFVFVSRHTKDYCGRYVSHGNPEKMLSAMKYNFTAKHPAVVVIKLAAIRRDMFFCPEVYKLCDGFCRYLFEKMSKDPIYFNDPLVAVARAQFEPESQLLFLHTGLY